MRVRLCVAGIAIVLGLAVAPGQRLQADADRIWFGPAPGALDYRHLFEQPEEWVRARALVNVFQFYQQHTESPPAGIVGPNGYDALAASGAFRALTAWGIKTAIEVGAVKEHWCTTGPEGMQGSIRATLDAVAAVQKAGGTVHYLTMDEPWVAGRQAICGGPALEPTADRLQIYMSAVRTAHPEIRLGLTEAYPYSSAAQFERMLLLLRERGVPPAFVHLDVDWHALKPGDFVRDVPRIAAAVRAEEVPFGIIIWGYNGDADALFASDAADLTNAVAETFGTWEQMPDQNRLPELGGLADRPDADPVGTAGEPALHAYEPALGTLPASPRVAGRQRRPRCSPGRKFLMRGGAQTNWGGRGAPAGTAAMWIRVAVLATAVGLGHASGAAAQELLRSARLTVDNDFLDFTRPPRQRPDDDYTQGARLRWDFRRAPRFAKRLVCADRPACGATFEIGQEMYTPIYGGPYPVPGDRPYAGWLYVKGELRGAGARDLRVLSLTVGTTGPPSLAGSAQREFHHLIPGFYEPVGWDNQLPTEPGFGVAGARSWRVTAQGPVGRFVDLIPTLSGAAGTLRMSIGAGVRARIGLPLIHPWLASDRPRFAPYAFAGASAEAVGRDLFLDGTAFRDSVRVEHRPAVAEWERGIGVGLDRLGLEYRIVTRSREYAAGLRSHAYGSVLLSWALR